MFLLLFIYFENPYNALLSFFFLGRETNLKFKMGLRVTDVGLQEERQLAAFNGGCCSLEQVTFICN